MVGDDLFKKLRKHIPDTAWVETDIEIEFLKTIFTREEAELALQIGSDYENITDISKKTGIDRSKLENVLERMTDKGILYTIEEKGKNSYKIMNPSWLMDLHLFRKENTPAGEKIAKLLPEYYMKAYGDRQLNKPVAITRVLPLEDALPKDELIYPWERISTVLESTDFLAVTNCICRRASEIRGDGCNHSLEVCPFLGDVARYLVKRGFAREITKEEAYKIQKKASDEGLVFITTNAQEYNTICNCCGCCCLDLWGINRLHLPNAVAKANFIAEVNGEQCTLCSTCVDKCSVHSPSLTNEHSVINEDTCIGCGVCVVSCPSEAIKLKRRREIQIPPRTMAELTSVTQFLPYS